MGRRGPAPKPAKLKLLQGTYRADRDASSPPTPETAVPSCPSWLHAEAKRVWRRITPQLEKLGLISEIDRDALAAYCQAYAEWWQMERIIADEGHFQTNLRSGHTSPHPAVRIRDAAVKTMRDYEREFGMTPSARTRVSAEKKDDKPGNAFAAFG